MIERYKIRLHVLTPIHIGSGDAYDPTQFVFDTDGQMLVFNTADFLAALNDKQLEEFSRICQNMHDIVPVFRFFKANFSKAIKHRAIKASPDLLARYEDVLKGVKSGNITNQFELKRTIYNECNAAPYIPGSSLKGCLKNIWMSSVATQLKLQGPNIEEKILCGSFNKDPFRFVKVSDLHAHEVKPEVEIRYAVSRSRKPDKAFKDNLTVPLELIMPGAVFEGQFSVGEPDKFPEPEASSRKVHFDALMKSAKMFYLNKISRLQEILRSVEASSSFVSKIGEFKEKLFRTCIPVKLGLHTGAEFITIDGSRRIKISAPGKPPKFGEEATTIWLASRQKKPDTAKGMQPFGWAVVEFEKTT